MTWIYIAIIALMVIFSAFFSGSEMAFNSANKMRLRHAFEEKGSKTAGMALKICENFTRSLSAILIGNNLVNIAASTAATSLFIDLLNGVKNGEAIASTVATVVMTVIILIFGEIVPKIVSKQNADSMVCYLALPIRILTIILFPAVMIVMAFINLLRMIWGKDRSKSEPDVTGDELVSIIDTVEEEGVIDEEKGELLQSSLEFNETAIEEVMTPRIDLVTIDINDSKREIRKTIEKSTYSRIPVYDDSIDDIIGVLYLNHYYKEAVVDPNVDISKLLIKPVFLHKTMKLPVALRHLRERRTHIAIVIDEFGGTLGVVTIEDILEEIVGEIWDESDEIINNMIEIAPNRYEVIGDMNIDDFFSEFDFEPKDFECEYSTVGGWAIENLDSDPHVGDMFKYEIFTVIVSEMEDDVRVTKLTVTVSEKEDEEE